MSTNIYEGCSNFVQTYLTLGCASSQSWGIISFFCIFGLSLFTIQYRRKKDKIVMTNLIYFAILLATSLTFLLLTAKLNNNSSLIDTSWQSYKIVDAGIKVTAVLLLVILLVRQDTLREVRADFTNTDNENKNNNN